MSPSPGYKPELDGGPALIKVVYSVQRGEVGHLILVGCDRTVDV